MPYFQPGPRLHALLDILAFIPTHTLVLPLTALFHGLRYWLVPRARRFPRLTWWRYVVLNVLRVRNQCIRGLCVNYPDPDADRRIPSKYDGECDVAVVRVPPMRDEVPRVDVLDARVVREGVVRPVEVAGFWIRAKRHHEDEDKHDLAANARPRERVIYFIVGGGYAHGHPLNPHSAFSFAKLTGARVFCINYRKSLDDGSAFPASLVDTLAGWQYLMDRGFDPSDVMLNGDSAGANACLALTRYLDALRRSFDWGLPGALALHCPWGDMTASFDSLDSNRYTDHLIDLSLVYIPSHARHFTLKERGNAYFSPALPRNVGDGHFRRLAAAGVRAYVMGGTGEGFFDEIVALKAGMRGAGMDVTFREIPGASHSEFVWMDRDTPSWAGWSWLVVKNDFENFWYATAR